MCRAPPIRRNHSGERNETATAAPLSAAATTCCVCKNCFPKYRQPGLRLLYSAKAALDPRPARGVGPGAVLICPLAGACGAASCSASRFSGTPLQTSFPAFLCPRCHDANPPRPLEVRRQGETELTASAHFVLVAVRRNTFESVSVPDEIRQRLAPYTVTSDE